MIIDNIKPPKKNDIESDMDSALDEATREMKTSATHSNVIDRDLQEAKPVLDAHTYDGSNLAQQTAATAAVLGTAITGLKNEIHDTDVALYQLTEQLSDDKSQRDKLLRLQSTKIANYSDKINRQQNEINLEGNTRVAAEELIEEQQSEIDRLRNYIDKMEQLLLQNRQENQVQQQQLSKSREMASNAAELARKAATARQQALIVAQAEKKVRENVELRAAKAMAIAKNAVSALADAESKFADKVN